MSCHGRKGGLWINIYIKSRMILGTRKKQSVQNMCHFKKPTKRNFDYRDHTFKTSANFHDFWHLSPYSRQVFTTIRRQIWPIFDPFPLKNADVLNGWSHSSSVQFHQINRIFFYKDQSLLKKSKRAKIHSFLKQCCSVY